MTHGDHLSESVMAALVDGRLDHGARIQALSHLDSCPECRAELIAVKSLADTYRVASSGKSSMMRWVPAGAAIAAGLAGILLVRSLILPAVPSETVRAPGSGSADAAPRIAAVAPRDGGMFVHRTFTWRSHEADSYRFVLMKEDGTPLWSLETHDTSLALPAEVPLEAGRIYFWRVDALADGIAASTGTMRLQVGR